MAGIPSRWHARLLAGLACLCLAGAALALRRLVLAAGAGAPALAGAAAGWAAWVVVCGLGLAACAAVLARQREQARGAQRLALAAAEGRCQQQALARALADRSATEDFLRLVADSLPGRLSYWDRDNRCRFANRGFCDWHGVTPAQMQGRRIADLGPPWDRRAAHNAPHVAAVLEGRAQRFERDDTTPAGQPCTSLAHYVPDRRGEQVVGFVVLATDLSAEKARERELAAALTRAEAATRAKSAFLANMSHEIRTPLNAILGLVQLLRQDSEAAASARRLAHVEDASRHLLALINDILDLSRVEAGKLTLEPRDFDLPALLDRVQALLAERARAKGLVLALQVGDVPVRVHADATRLTQVLLNLAGNAVKFTEQGQVTLTAALCPDPGQPPATGWRVRFEVADTGPGIAPERLATLFQPFEQGDASMTRRYGGSGLGLAISREVVALLGGRIEVDSRPGEGARFAFTLVLPPPQVPAPVPLDVGAAVQALRQRHAGRRVLLVEDNPINQVVASELLHAAGLCVALAANGAQALGEAQRQAPALILMDVQMPVMDGLAATREWRAHEARSACPRTPVVALTATAFAAERGACLQAGMDDHLTKPIDAAQLYTLLLRWLDDPTAG
ncbi:PAS domain-containing sensor histidine kinase [Aquabacterium sp. OR-4]|uniref:PAS domain-containing sensor histidine kinase n=1 Tax=Aquabacterium sp. OR-4 TaxID=2978127 RepID=UPI0021B23655|nr:PAS domain-containing sensor histidine kinase [Aquabacterium sp. OR-4]MDT7834058.1 ATP-binding protein [Aquabacterium sp. OR-4]